MERTSESPQIPHFSAADWQACGEMLWDQAYAVGEESTSLQAQADKAFGEASRLRESKNHHDQEEGTKKEGEYWSIMGRLDAAKDHEAALLETLERIEAGEATEEEVLPLLPQEEDQPKEKLSKRKQAILRERERIRSLGILPRLEYLDLFEFEVGQDRTMLPTADAHRVASGRNRSKLTSTDKLYAGDAEGRFIEATRDTHGGKVRRPGKNSNSYARSDGRRIRKR